MNEYGRFLYPRFLGLRGNSMVYCWKCGKEIPKESNFCQSCGMKVHEEVILRPPPPPPPPKTPPQRVHHYHPPSQQIIVQQPKRGIASTIILIIVILIVVFVVLFVVFALLSSMQGTGVVCISGIILPLSIMIPYTRYLYYKIKKENHENN